MPMETAERVLALYQDKYSGLNVSHFHEQLSEVEGIEISCSWVIRTLHLTCNFLVFRWRSQPAIFRKLVENGSSARYAWSPNAMGCSGSCQR
jgi:hypothetical protein